jgi:sterol desaturase/sphingolipid hydroxylase (fatty acid hydroxylase superfamily)
MFPALGARQRRLGGDAMRTLPLSLMPRTLLAWSAVAVAGIALSILFLLWNAPPGSLIDRLVARVDWYAAIAIPAGMLVIELAFVGWQRSSLRKLLVGRSASARSDIAYQVLTLFGGAEVLTRLFACGLIGVIEGLMQAQVGLFSLAELPPWLRWPLLFLTGNFFGYWQHRAMHSRWLWSIHKSHHSAEEFTVVNAFRGHPLEFVFGGIAAVLPLVLLGFPAGDVALYMTVAGFVAAYVHSNLIRRRLLNRALEAIGLMTPSAHKVHHSLRIEHRDTNFGDMVNVWDRLFGTYVKPPADVFDIEIGVDDMRGRHSTLNPLREIAAQTADWLANLRREAAALSGRRSTDAPG